MSSALSAGYGQGSTIATSEIDVSQMAIDPSGAMPPDFVPVYCMPTFGKDGVIKGDLKDGYFVPSGSVLPLGAGIPARTVLKYGGFFCQGTSFPGGIIVPLHARMVNVLPMESKPPAVTQMEPLCCIQ